MTQNTLAGRIAVADRRKLLGYAASLTAAFGYGIGALASRKVVDDYASPMVATAFSLMFGTIMVAAVFYRDVPKDIATAPLRAWVLVALAGLAAAWGVGFFFLAISEGAVVRVAPVVGAYPLITILLSYVFLGRLERVTWRTVAGAVLVVVGVALIAIGRG